VLSRCLQFSLKRLSVAMIGDRIRQILEAESVPFEAAAVRLVAIAADGSMRDGLSLLDQLIAFGGGRVEETAARAMLGTVDRQQVVRIAELLAAGEPAGLLNYARTLEDWSPDHAQMLDALAALLARVALKQAVPDYEGDELHGTELLSDLAARLAAEDVQLYYQAAIMGRRDLQWAPDPRTGFEMTLLRMLAFRPLADSPGSVGTGAARPASGSPAVGGARAERPAAREAGAAPAVGGAAAAVAVSQAERPAPRAAATGGAATWSADDWASLVGALELTGLSRQLAAHCALVGRDGALIRLALDPRNQHVRTTAAVERLAQALCRHLGETVRVEIDVGEPPAETPARAEERQAREHLVAARESLEADPTVQAMKEKFGATLRADTVRPHR
jgi:DNA polymerase-3 subunit gamma/tau